MSRLIENIKRNMKKMPQKVAIYCNEKKITYGELDIACQTMIYTWKTNGVNIGDKVAVILPNSIEFVICMLAAAELGAVIVPLDPSIPVKAMLTAFEAADVKHLVLTRKECLKLELPSYGTSNSMCLLVDEYDWVMAENPGNIVKPDDISEQEDYIFTMTSGSTGNPKPIVLSQKNKYERAHSCIESYGISEDDVILAATPLYHSLAERLVLVPLLIGATSVIMQRYTADLWIDTVKKYNVSFTIAVSSQLAQILDILKKGTNIELGGLRCVVSSSALLSFEVKKELLKYLKCEFFECYGTSETAVITDIGNDEAKGRISSVGKPLKNVSIKIIDENGNEVSCGEKGEIVCDTYMLFKGYYHMEKETKEAMYEERYFKTGDIGYVDEEGYLYYAGRKKEIIITGAINVYPKDIEEVIEKMPEILECAAFPWEDEKLGEVVAVALVLDKDGVFDERKMKFYCLKNLAPYQQPRKYFVIKELPRNRMGKLMRYRIREVIEERL